MTRLHAEIAENLMHDSLAVALGDDGDMSYSDLAARSAALLAPISALSEDQSVGILSTRKWEAYAAAVACFFGGRRFVPLNPELPLNRLTSIVDQGQIGLVIHDKSNAKLAAGLNRKLIDPATLSISEKSLQSCVQPNDDDVAYQMFTSGSTGTPKGVPVSYGSLSHYVETVRPSVDLQSSGRYSQVFDLSFDLAMHDIFVALANGGTIVPASPMDIMMPHVYIRKKRIDHWFSVPMLAMVAARGAGKMQSDHRLTTALFCGEPLPMAYARDFRQFVAEGVPIWNLYGPTEATIAFTAKAIDFSHDMASVAPLGEPFGDNLIAVESSNGQVCDVAEGVTGQLLLGGPQVFKGYSPDTGADCFTKTTPIYYRSGDMVRMMDGELHHIGRSDNQIKLRGYRIELGEIEAAVRRAFELDTVACVVVGEGESRQIAVAYSCDTDIVSKSILSDYLPSYMAPQLWMRMDTLPLNVNGKIDRKSLQTLDWFQ